MKCALATIRFEKLFAQIAWAMLFAIYYIIYLLFHESLQYIIIKNNYAKYYILAYSTLLYIDIMSRVNK